MTTTYVAWNGQAYPWPPPAGWYEGSDGRWWAPGSGPGPRQAVDPSRTVDVPPPTRPKPTPVLIKGDRQPDGGSPGPLPTITAAVDPDPGRSRRSPKLLAAAVIAAAAMAAAATFVSLAGSDETAEADEATAPSTLSPANDPAGPPATPDGADTADATEAGGGTDADSAPADSSSTTVASDITSTSAVSSGAGASAATTAQTATTLPSPAQLAAVIRFRELLAAQGFDSELLSDANIRDFGNAFCVFAAVADDGATFADFRARTVSERDASEVDVTSGLSEDDMARTVDVAVTAFCPDQARRLGLIS